jgi:hypothetical protein
MSTWVHVTDCTDVLCHDCRAVELDLIPKFRERIAGLDDYQTCRRNELERAIERIEWYATLEGPAPLAQHCEYDSGSATGCRPLCTDKAAFVVAYRNGGRFSVKVCKRHRRAVENNVWHSYESTTAL